METHQANYDEGNLTKKTEEQKFITVKNNKLSVIRTNSLYNLITQLIEEDSVLIKPYDLSNPKNTSMTEERMAYFLKLDIAIVEPLYNKKDDGFQLVDRHLTVDKLYSCSPKHWGLSIAHYTEKYVNQQDNTYIKVHVYFSMDPQYTVQIKQFVSGTRTTYCNDQAALRSFSLLMFQGKSFS